MNYKIWLAGETGKYIVVSEFLSIEWTAYGYMRVHLNNGQTVNAHTVEMSNDFIIDVTG